MLKLMLIKLKMLKLMLLVLLWVALLLFVVVVEVVAVLLPRYSECRRAIAAVGRVVSLLKLKRKVESERGVVESCASCSSENFFFCDVVPYLRIHFTTMLSSIKKLTGKFTNDKR